MTAEDIARCPRMVRALLLLTIRLERLNKCLT